MTHITPPLQHTDNQDCIKQRILGLDILRALAIICVICGHWFICTDYSVAPFAGAGMFLLGMLQTFTLIGVPLFMMLTGYLNLNKLELSRRYYSGIWRVVWAYLLFSIVAILFREYYVHEHYSALKWFSKITNFSAIRYAWYIEMWIGLFLFTPFLNRLWVAMSERRTRLMLIATLFVCSSLPASANQFGQLLPQYWQSAAYPLLAFYIGAYIRTYRPQFDTVWLITIITALCLITPVASLIAADGGHIIYIHGGPQGIVSMSVGVCVFLLFYRTDISYRPARAFITKISLLSLDMYLVAACIDKLLYPIWKQHVGSTQAELILWYVPIVLSLLTGCFVTAWLKDIIATLALRTVRKLPRPCGHRNPDVRTN